MTNMTTNDTWTSREWHDSISNINIQVLLKYNYCTIRHMPPYAAICHMSYVLLQIWWWLRLWLWQQLTVSLIIKLLILIINMICLICLLYYMSVWHWNLISNVGQISDPAWVELGCLVLPLRRPPFFPWLRAMALTSD